jgi:hypothetical protein
VYSDITLTGLAAGELGQRRVGVGEAVAVDAQA